jgi:hypothetical protein
LERDNLSGGGVVRGREMQDNGRQRNLEEKEKGLWEVVLFCVRRGKGLEEKVT